MRLLMAGLFISQEKGEHCLVRIQAPQHSKHLSQFNDRRQRNEEEFMTIEELSKKVQHLSDVQEIIQLQGKYQYWLFKQEWAKMVDCFVQHTPGAMMEASDSGVFREVEGIKRFFLDHMARLSHVKGFFTMHLAASPVIEVSKDGRAAKSRWFSPGCFGAAGVEDCWVWGIYMIDYVKEDGVWKMWHVNFSPFFRTPYHKGWGEMRVSASVRDGLEDGPPTAWNPYDSNKTGPVELFHHHAD